MPFLSPNQQRQSTEGTYLKLLRYKWDPQTSPPLSKNNCSKMVPHLMSNTRHVKCCIIIVVIIIIILQLLPSQLTQTSKSVLKYRTRSLSKFALTLHLPLSSTSINPSTTLGTDTTSFKLDDKGLTHNQVIT